MVRIILAIYFYKGFFYLNAKCYAFIVWFKILVYTNWLFEMDCYNVLKLRPRKLLLPVKSFKSRVLMFIRLSYEYVLSINLICQQKPFLCLKLLQTKLKTPVLVDLR